MENVILDRVSDNPRYAIEARSCIGGRRDQQDRAYAYCDEHDVFALVCDGMGGAVDGGIASETAVSAMRQAYKDYLTNKIEAPSSFLHRAMVIADKDVSERIDYKAGGTTMVVVLIRNGLLYWLSVGDSRLYILRSGELLQVTRDHNYLLRLNELKERGEISDNLYRKEADRGDALISYIGLGDITLFDLTQSGFELKNGDRLLLATDGLFKVLPQTLMQGIIEAEIDISLRADSLIAELSRQAEVQTQDNTTFIIVDVL